jgi:Ca2+/Na+ antiporter
MNRTTPGPAHLEWLLAGTLHYGTSLASAVIGLGLGLALINSRFGAPKQSILRDMSIVTIGIALFILLPVVRVIVMLIVYLRQRDYRLAAIALLVLTIILLGFTVGLAGSKHHDTRTSRMEVRGKTDPPDTMRAISLEANSFLTARAACVRPPGVSFTTKLRRIEYERYLESDS